MEAIAKDVPFWSKITHKLFVWMEKFSSLVDRTEMKWSVMARRLDLGQSIIKWLESTKVDLKNGRSKIHKCVCCIQYFFSTQFRRCIGKGDFGWQDKMNLHMTLNEKRRLYGLDRKRVMKFWLHKSEIQRLICSTGAGSDERCSADDGNGKSDQKKRKRRITYPKRFTRSLSPLILSLHPSDRPSVHPSGHPFAVRPTPPSSLPFIIIIIIIIIFFLLIYTHRRHWKQRVDTGRPWNQTHTAR